MAAKEIPEFISITIYMPIDKVKEMTQEVECGYGMVASLKPGNLLI